MKINKKVQYIVVLVLVLFVLYFINPIGVGIQNGCGVSLSCWSFFFRNYERNPKITNDYEKYRAFDAVLQTDNECLAENPFKYLCSRVCFDVDSKVFERCQLLFRDRMTTIDQGDLVHPWLCTTWGCTWIDENCNEVCLL